MEKVVYILGAGFSAPLGLPLMNNFLLKAKDMYAEDAKKYAHFADVFDQIASMAVAKNYYEADLFSIEEILSILEMTNRLSGGDTKAFVNFLCDVIDYHTPVVPDPQLRAANWYDTVLGQWTHYFAFVCSLFGIRLWTSETAGKIVMDISRLPNQPCEYSVISLNYDLVLEEMAEAVNKLVAIRKVTCAFAKSFTDPSGHAGRKITVPLAKLHGSADGRNVIAPTWNKGLEASDIIETWSMALKLLSEANHIRIIGYSLPESDAYIRYLLKSAAIHAPHLKSFNVICSDSSGRTHERYNDFVTFNYFRFVNERTEGYLHLVFDNKTGDAASRAVSFDGLEKAHSYITR